VLPLETPRLGSGLASTAFMMLDHSRGSFAATERPAGTSQNSMVVNIPDDDVREYTQHISEKAGLGGLTPTKANCRTARRGLDERGKRSGTLGSPD
jgi:hypothetical protein